VDRKYCRRGNIFCAEKNQVSPFWKGVLLAAQAFKMGYRWVVGDRKKIGFWEDTLFGSAPPPGSAVLGIILCV
jgi:hypothetical protein